MQRGCIHLTGGRVTDPQPACGNLFDFIGATHVGDRMLISFTDGCARCADAKTSTGSAVRVAAVDAGLG